MSFLKSAVDGCADSSEVSTQIDSVDDGDKPVDQGKSSSAAVSQAKRDVTMPGDDQSLLDLAELTSHFLLKKEALDQLKGNKKSKVEKAEHETALTKEIATLARGKSYFENVCYAEIGDEVLEFYQRCAGRACLKWQQTRQAGRGSLVTECYQQAFEYLEKAIKSRQEEIRCNRDDELDNLETGALYSLGRSYFEEGWVRENQNDPKKLAMCEQAREAFEGALYAANNGQRYRDFVHAKGESLSDRLKIIATMTNLSISSGIENQKQGNKLLDQLQHRESW